MFGVSGVRRREHWSQIRRQQIKCGALLYFLYGTVIRKRGRGFIVAVSDDGERGIGAK